MPIRQQDTYRALKLLEEFRCRLAARPGQQKLAAAIEKLILVCNSRLFQALIERGSDKLVWGEGETIQDYLRRVDAYALLGDEKKTIGKTLLGLGHRISVIDSLSDTDKSSVTNLKAALLREFGDTTQQSQRQFLTRRKRDGHRLPLEARASGAPVHSVQVRLGHDCLLEPHSERVVEELKAAHATVVEREERTKRRRQELSSRNAHVARYKKGDLVFQRCPPKPGRPGKLQPRWDGPYIVVECRQGNVYLIKKADNFRRRYVRHHDRLKPFEDRGERLGAPPPPPAGRAPAGEEREDGQRDPSDESSDSSPSLDEERTELSSSASDESDEEAEAASGDPPPRRGSRQRKPASRWPEGQWTQ
ncbi:Disks large 1 [Amphibalanus amphitrite]|uniref:Disks large 1 n=1 Tax=Amphibalanus amphitrite TaxID=1232801 RepID=A0A6A4W0S5_AMPAM|nr:Disks large 1 [Amphibalanus amphitrite]